MKVYLTKWMARFSRREGIDHANLCEAVARAEMGLIDADLGGGLIKQRVARPGKGRSGGYRTLLAYRRNDRAVFIFAFAKSSLSDIAPDQMNTARELGAKLLAWNTKELEKAKREGEIEEIPYEH